MRCTSGSAYQRGQADRPCNQGLVPIPYYGRKNRVTEHETPVHVCPYCDAVGVWPPSREQEQG